MKYITYNNEKISQLCLGTVQFGLKYGIANKIGQPSENSVNDILDYSIKKGVNCFDTAQDYGESEKILGNYFKKNNSFNNLIISKIKSEHFFTAYSILYENVQNSCRKLHNNLFALLLHDNIILKNWNSTYTDYINQLKSQNLIKYFGASIYTDEEFNLALNNKNIQIIQIPFNVFDQRAIKNNWFEKAKKHNKLLFIRSIFLQGLLLMDDIPSQFSHSKKYFIKYNEIAEKTNLTKSELALTFVLHNSFDSIIIFGCVSIEQAKINLNNYHKILNHNRNIHINNFEFFSNVPEKIYNPVRWQK